MNVKIATANRHVSIIQEDTTVHVIMDIGQMQLITSTVMTQTNVLKKWQDVLKYVPTHLVVSTAVVTRVIILAGIEDFVLILMNAKAVSMVVRAICVRILWGRTSADVDQDSNHPEMEKIALVNHVYLFTNP